jgi:hypothetical protein
MKKLAYVAGAAAVGLAATYALVGRAPESQAADHKDSTALALPANHAADINDVYAWNTADKTKVNLVMTVAPFAAAGDTFGTGILYTFHVNPITPMANGTLVPGVETRIICKFASNTSAQCWVGADGYVAGDPSAAAGISSTDGKIKLFAGLRADPFFFNLDGFKNTVATVATKAATGMLPAPDARGCYPLGAAAIGVAGLLTKNADGSAAGTDTFAGAKVLAIVLQVDKTLLVGAGTTIVSVWGSTNQPGA